MALASLFENLSLILVEPRLSLVSAHVVSRLLSLLLLQVAGLCLLRSAVQGSNRLGHLLDLGLGAAGVGLSPEGALGLVASRSWILAVMGHGQSLLNQLMEVKRTFVFASERLAFELLLLHMRLEQLSDELVSVQQRRRLLMHAGLRHRGRIGEILL